MGRQGGGFDQVGTVKKERSKAIVFGWGQVIHRYALDGVLQRSKQGVATSSLAGMDWYGLTMHVVEDG